MLRYFVSQTMPTRSDYRQSERKAVSRKGSLLTGFRLEFTPYHDTGPEWQYGLLPFGYAQRKLPRKDRLGLV
ncbi:MAG: hypothetical protein AABZ77_08965 [Chloroflexota bacterium]